MAPLTQGEAVRRGGLLAVERYDVELDLRGLEHGTTLRSRSRVTFGCTDPGASTFADVVADELVSARLNGADLPASGWDGERLQLTGLTGRNVLEVETRTDRTGQQSGVHRAVDPADGLAYVWTSYEPDDARRVFACFDQPDLKAAFGFTVLAPAGWVVASATSAGAEEADDGSRVWRFPDTPRLSTYVTVVCAGPYASVEREADGRRLVLMARRSLTGRLREGADELFDLTGRGLAFFAERFGTELPLPVYTQVFCPEFFGAMENYGCVTWADTFLFRAAPTAAERRTRAMVLLHEMAHMWFGDLVTLRWWDDLWLNESFASWASHWALDALDPASDAWLLFLAEKESGYTADRAPTTHPVYQPVPDTAAAMAAFDALTYAKGASVLKQLVATVGERAFLGGLQRYFREHAWSNATLGDLLAAVGEAAGRDLAAWAQPWLRTSGAATLELDRGEAGRPVLGQSVPPLPDGGPGPLRPHRLEVSAFRADGNALAPLGTRAMTLDGAATPLDDGDGAADLVLVNDADLTYARVRLDERSTATALRLGHTLPAAMSRALVRLSLWQQVDDGRTPPADVLGWVVTALTTEDDALVRGQLLRTALDGIQGWLPAGAGLDLGRRLAGVALDRAAAVPEGDAEARSGWLRAAARAAHPDQFTQVAQAVSDDVDLGWRALTRRAAFDRADDGEIEALLGRDPDPYAWVRAAAVRAARPDAAAKDQVWTTLVETESIPASAGHIAEAFWQPGQDDVLRPFAQRYLDVLPGLAGRNLVVMLALPAWLFPVVGVDASFPEQVLAAATRPGVTPVVARVARERADVLTRMLRARALPVTGS